jgi:hypothetical protein
MTRCIIIPVGFSHPLARTELVGLQDFQRAIGGWVEHVGLNQELVLLVDEEGRVKGLPINPRATLLRRLYHPASRDQLAIVGSAVLIGAVSQEKFGDVPVRIEQLLIDSTRFIVRAKSGDEELTSTPFDSFWDASQVAIVADIAEALDDVEVISFE